MKKQNFVTILRCFVKKSACVEHLRGANFFAVLLVFLSTFVLFRTFAFSALNEFRLQHAIA